MSEKLQRGLLLAQQYQVGSSVPLDDETLSQIGLDILQAVLEAEAQIRDENK